MNRISQYGLVCLLIAALTIWGVDAHAEDSPTPKSTNSNTLWTQANKLYTDGKYKDALELYKSILDQLGPAPEVYYNAGNAFAMLGEKGKAALMYERTLELNPRHKDAQQNLKLLAPADNFPPVFVLFRPIWFVKERMTGAETAWLAAGFYIAGFLGLALVTQVSNKSRKNVLRAVSIVFLGIAVFFMTIIWNRWTVETNRPAAIILNNSIARSGPSQKNKSVLELPEGLKVREKSRPADGWVEIQLLTGQTAFVPESDIERI